MTICPDSETAVKVFPLFAVFHSVDLRYILNCEDYKRLDELKESFDKKQVLRRRNSSVCSVDTEPEYVEPIEDKIAIDSIKLKKITEMTEQKINFFKAIVECFDEVMKVEGQLSAAKDLKVFWDSVTSLVKSKGLRIYTDDHCREFFRECVNDYYSVVFILIL